MNYVLARMGVKAAWTIMDAGDGIVSFAEKIEERTSPDTALCAFSWRLIKIGERIQDWGIAACEWADRQAVRLGCNLDYLMGDILVRA